MCYTRSTIATTMKSLRICFYFLQIEARFNILSVYIAREILLKVIINPKSGLKLCSKFKARVLCDMPIVLIAYGMH